MSLKPLNAVAQNCLNRYQNNLALLIALCSYITQNNSVGLKWRRSTLKLTNESDMLVVRMKPSAAW